MRKALKKSSRAEHHELARCVTIEKKPLPKRPGTIAVICAGTSDCRGRVEAALTADIMGNTVVRITDAGVAGLYRIPARLETLQQTALSVVAGWKALCLKWVVAGW